jgi:hypothetical protein
VSYESVGNQKGESQIYYTSKKRLVLTVPMQCLSGTGVISALLIVTFVAVVTKLVEIMVQESADLILVERQTCCQAR